MLGLANTILGLRKTSGLRLAKSWTTAGQSSLFAAIVSLLNVSCVSTVELPQEEPVEDCSVEARKEFVGGLMRDYYLWYDKIPEAIDYAAIETPEALMQAMMYREVDRWSGMQELVARNQYYSEGRYQGFGYTLGRDEEGGLRISWSHEGSPAGEANFARGDKLTEVNGRLVSELTDQQLSAELNGDVVEHTLLSLLGEERTVELTRGDVEITSVKSLTVLDRDDGKLGYLMFTNFVGPADGELREAFASFQAAGVEKLVVDLRYNSGGLLSIAALLGSLIRRDAAGQALIVETYNDQHPDDNRRRLLYETEEGLNVSQVVFLTGSRTASASEQVINGMRPYLDVKVVGTRTLGKPVGADSWENCGFAIVPITFQSLNAEGEGDFFDGIVPDCFADDDLLHILGDPSEVKLQEALSLLDTDSCSLESPEPKAGFVKSRKQKRPLPAGPILGVPGTY